MSQSSDHSPDGVGVAKLLSLAGDPRVIQFLLLLLVLDAVGFMDKIQGVCF